jgi:hypothetical protein
MAVLDKEEKETNVHMDLKESAKCDFALISGNHTLYAQIPQQAWEELLTPWEFPIL